MAPKRRKADESESADDYSDDDDGYSEQANDYYKTKSCAPLTSKSNRIRSNREKLRDLAKEEEKMNKMLNEPSEAEEESAGEAEEGEAPGAIKGRATGKDLVPCELHPLDHVIELIIFDRIKEKPSPVQQKIKSVARSATIDHKSQEETKEGTNEEKIEELKQDVPAAQYKIKDTEQKEGENDIDGDKAEENASKDAEMVDETNQKKEQGAAEEEDKAEASSAQKKQPLSEKENDESSDGEDLEDSQPYEIVEEFLCKLKGLGYLETKWLTEADFQNYSFQCQQKLKRYLIKREKLAKGLAQPTTDQNLQPGEYYDHHYVLPDKVLTSTNLFPIIHPRQAKNVIGTWRERCIMVLQHIMGYRGEDQHYYSTPFIFLRTDERSVMDFTTINNRLYTIPSAAMQQQAAQNPQKVNSFYQGPHDFWTDLGQVFIEGLSNYNTQQREYFFIRRLRELAYYFYLAWRKQIVHIHAEKIKNPPKVEKKTHLVELVQLLNRKASIDQQIKQAKMQFQAAPNLANQQALAQLVPQNSMVISNLDKILNQNFSQVEGGETKPPPELSDSEEKLESFKVVCVNLPKYLATLKYEMSPSGPGQPGGVNLIQNVTGDPSTYRSVLIQALNKLVPPLDVDKETKPVDKQKEMEQTALAGQLVLGVNLLTDLGSGEEAITTHKESFDWLLKKTETVEQILEDAMFDGEVIFNMLMKGVQSVDPIYFVKWINLSYTDCTWEAASLIRKQDETDSKIKDFERFNRSLDNNSRQKMMGFGYAHKQILKIYSKKLAQGRKIDHRSAEELQTREMLSKLLKFEGMTQSKGYFQYNYEQNLVPQFRLSQKCKDYQISGLNWMLRAFQDNRNIVLADEMGLGKTIQCVALLDHLIKICKIRGPFLVIAPLSTLAHWKDVAEQWTYMNVVVFHDRSGADGRQKVRDLDWYYTDVTNKGTITQKSKLIKFNLMITSYEVFNSELTECLKEVPFQYVVVDEAHRLKNKQAKTLMLLKEHPCRRILLLTGTPIQNNTKELFTLLNYLEPEQFHNFDKFMEKYGMLKSADQVDQLHKILKPHFLRRLKDEVEDSIPPLRETVVEVSLTPQQQQYYRGIYGENLAMLATLGQGGVKTFNFNNIDMQLRKCCNHLYLLKGVEEDLTKKCRTEADLQRSMLESSGKLQLLDKFIDKYREDGHKMLVFSQFKGMVELIKDYLQMRKIRFEVLTGNVKSQDRVTAIQRFNEDSEFGIFLLTTRAGGLGINLTKARVVVIFDSDWNPQNDLQAIARAHRIGQIFEVEVYRFITAKTYEQQMFDRASKKLGMEQALFQKGAFHDQQSEDNADMNKINPEEVERLLKYGAYAFLDEDMLDDNSQDAEKQAANSMKIEDILKNKKEKGTKKSSKAYTLQKSTFTIADMTGSKKDSGKSSTTKANAKTTADKEAKPKLNINDPNFWEKVLPFDGFNPKQLSRKFRIKKTEILKTKDSQSKFLKEISRCVDDTLSAKSMNPSLEIDEELYDLLKRINKTKQFEHKYRTKSTVLLDKLLHFNDYRIMDGDDGQRLQRKAKAKPKDYKEKSSIHGRRRKKADSKRSGASQGLSGDDYDDLQSDSQEEKRVSKVEEKQESDPIKISSPKHSPKTQKSKEKKSAKKGKLAKGDQGKLQVKMTSGRKQLRVSSLDEIETQIEKEMGAVAEEKSGGARDSLARSEKSDKKTSKKRKKVA